MSDRYEIVVAAGRAVGHYLDGPRAIQAAESVAAGIAWTLDQMGERDTTTEVMVFRIGNNMRRKRVIEAQIDGDRLHIETTTDWTEDK